MRNKFCKPMMVILIIIIPVLFSCATPQQTFVAIDKSVPSYTLYFGIPAGFPEKKFEELKKEAAKEKGREIITWEKFKQDPHKYITARIIKNEYSDYQIEKGMTELIRKTGAEGVPIGLTWNGGVAFNRSDYEHAERTYREYQNNPSEYERTRIRDPKRDPINPGNHFLPLLGNSYTQGKPTGFKDAKVNLRQGMYYLETTDFIFCFPPGFESVQPRAEETIYIYGNENGDSINISQYNYLGGKELNEQFCGRITRKFDQSELRAMVHASEAKEIEFRYEEGTRSCYYNYEFTGPRGKSRVEYKVYEREGQQAYAITIVYSVNSPDQANLRKALHSFSIKKDITGHSNP